MHKVGAVKVVCDANARQASWTFQTTRTKSRVEASHSWLAWWLWKPKAGLFCVHQTAERRIWIKIVIYFKLNLQMAGTRVYISLLPAYTSNLISSHIEHTASILDCFDIMRLTQNNSSRSRTHSITYTLSYLPSGLPPAASNCIIMLTQLMKVQFQLTAMDPMSNHKGNGKATAGAEMPTSVINRPLRWIGAIYMESSRNTSVDSYAYTMSAASRMRGHGTCLMINSLLIQSQLSTFHNSTSFGRTGRSGVSIFGSGGQTSTHISGKRLTKPMTKWTIGGGTIPVPSGIKSIVPIRWQAALGRLHAPTGVSLSTVVLIAGQWLTDQAANSTSQATSWPLDHWIGMR